MADQTVELSDPANQMVSTLNTSGAIFLLNQRTSVESTDRAINQLLLDTSAPRTYMGAPISVEYLSSPNHWLDLELFRAILEHSARLGISSEEIGYAAFIGKCSFKHAIGFTIVKMIGLQNTIKRAQCLISIYNRCKTITCTFKDKTELNVAMDYLPGIHHNQFITQQNTGILKAIWESLGYSDYQVTVLSDKIGTSTSTGSTLYQVIWSEQSGWQRISSQLRQRLVRWLTDDCSYLSLFREDQKNPLFEAYVSEYEEKLKTLRQLEHHFMTAINSKNQQIAAQEIELRKLKNRLVDRFEQWIEENYQRSDVTIEKAVEEIGTTVSTLNRRLKERGLPTSKKMLNDFRLNRAKQLLKSRKPSEVYLDCGFKTASHFAQSYRTRFGSPPSLEYIDQEGDDGKVIPVEET